jgi:hypothetical protein
MNSHRPEPRINDRKRRLILGAVERIVRGEANHRSLTLTDLAEEAGVGWATLNRAPDLKTLYGARIDAEAESDRESPNPRIRVRQLERQLAGSRARVRELERTGRIALQQIQYLALLLERERAAPRAAVLDLSHKLRDGNLRD